MMYPYFHPVNYYKITDRPELKASIVECRLCVVDCHQLVGVQVPNDPIFEVVKTVTHLYKICMLFMTENTHLWEILNRYRQSC